LRTYYNLKYVGIVEILVIGAFNVHLKYAIFFIFKFSANYVIIFSSSFQYTDKNKTKKSRYSFKHL